MPSWSSMPRLAAAALLLLVAMPAHPQINPPIPRPPDPPKVDVPKPPDPPPVNLPKPDLVIDSITSTDQKVPVGKEFTISVKVRNIGAGAATDVNVRVTFPDGIELVRSLQPDRFKPCTRSGNTVTCTDKTSPMPLPLLYQQSVTTAFKVKATAAGSPSFQATADGQNRVPETSESNNGGSMSVQAVDRPSLQITANGPTSSRTVGQTFGMWCSVKNLGPVAANANVTVTLQGTEEFDLKSVTPTTGCGRLFVPDTGRVMSFTCTTATQPNGVKAYSMNIVGKAPSTVTLTCSVGAEFENSTGDNEGQTTATITKAN